MWKATSVLAGAVLLAAAAAILPGVTPSVEASTPAPVQNGEKLEKPDCPLSGWPYYRADCLRETGRSAGRISQVRLVTTDRLPDPRPAAEPQWPLFLDELQTALPAALRRLQ